MYIFPLVEVVNDIITRWLTYIYNSRGGLVEVVNDIITRWLTYIYNSRGGLVEVVNDIITRTYGKMFYFMFNANDLLGY
jgi:hypothetical protein